MKPNPRQPQAADWLKRRDHAQRTHEQRRASYREFQRERLVRDWLGGVMAPDQMAELRGPARSTSDLVGEVLDKLDRNGAFALHRLAQRWAELVGEDIARVSSPVRLEDGVLWIGVTNTTWRYVLEQEFRGRLRGQLKEATNGDVRDIRLVPAGGAASTRRFGNGNRPTF